MNFVTSRWLHFPRYKSISGIAAPLTPPSTLAVPPGVDRRRVPSVRRSVLSSRGIVATLSPNFSGEIRYRRRRAGRYGKLFPCARDRQRVREETSTPHLACH